MLTAKPADCLSNLVMDRLVAKEVLVGARAHLDSCDACRARLDLVREQRASYQAQMPAFEGVRRASSRAKLDFWQDWKSRIPRIGFAFSIPLAATVALFIYWRQSPNEVAELTRSKGAPTLEFYVKRAQGVTLGGVHEELRQNDAVSFSYSSDRDLHLVILSLDGASQISVYHADNDHAEPIASALDRQLAGSIILDHVLGSERIFGFFCRDRIAVQEARAALLGNPDDPALEGCSVSQLRWKKIAP